MALTNLPGSGSNELIQRPSDGDSRTSLIIRCYSSLAVGIERHQQGIPLVVSGGNQAAVMTSSSSNLRWGV